MENQQELITMCPICKEERKFIRVVEAHEETHIPDNPVMGGTYPSYVQKTPHPTAYCSSCKVVIFIGPSPADVRADFDKKQEERRSRKEKRLGESFFR